MNLDDRLRAASQALKDNSVSQVDAASRLREVLGGTGRRVAQGPAGGLADRPSEPMGHAARSPALPAARLRRTAQRLALAVNLLLVLALGVLLVLGVRYGQDRAATTTGEPPASSTVVTQAKAKGQPVTNGRVPPACLDVARRGDELIHLFSTNERGPRLEAALKAYVRASQQCRRLASP
jgi:hypothetical protein